MQGRHTGAFVRFRDGALDQAVPPTGREIDFERIHVLALRDGKVAGHEAVRDDMTMLGRLGVFPPAPPTAVRMLAWRATGRTARAAAEVTARAAAAAALLGPDAPLPGAQARLRQAEFAASSASSSRPGAPEARRRDGHDVQDRQPTCARACLSSTPWPPGISLWTTSEAASCGLNHTRSRAS